MNSASVSEFVNLSAELCGFSAFTLRGTGFTDGYYSTVVGVIGDDTMKRLLAGYAALPSNGSRDQALRATILSDPEFGPIARNIVKLWFVSTWFQLPDSWREAYGASQNDQTFIPFTAAYAEGLLWPAVGSHPSGVKPQGYASWTGAPEPVDFHGDLRL